MGRCQDCSYVYKDKDGFFGVTYRCSLLGHKVNGGWSCDKFREAPTFYNSNGGGGGCYLTSACVGHLGKPDDCEELTILRVFRDLYMGNTEEGRALVKEYYEVAPKIVEKIDASADKDKYYDRIYAIVEKCVGLIKERKYAEAQTEYTSMTRTLKAELL